jgi:hypothetical protein
MDAPARQALQRASVFTLMFMLTLVRLRTPEALLESPNIFRTSADAKSYSHFFCAAMDFEA